MGCTIFDKITCWNSVIEEPYMQSCLLASESLQMFWLCTKLFYLTWLYFQCSRDEKYKERICKNIRVFANIFCKNRALTLRKSLSRWTDQNTSLSHYFFSFNIKTCVAQIRGIVEILSMRNIFASEFGKKIYAHWFTQMKRENSKRIDWLKKLGGGFLQGSREEDESSRKRAEREKLLVGKWRLQPGRKILQIFDTCKNYLQTNINLNNFKAEFSAQAAILP